MHQKKKQQQKKQGKSSWHQASQLTLFLPHPLPCAEFQTKAQSFQSVPESQHPIRSQTPCTSPEKGYQGLSCWAELKKHTKYNVNKMVSNSSLINMNLYDSVVVSKHMYLLELLSWRKLIGPESNQPYLLLQARLYSAPLGFLHGSSCSTP